MTELPVQALPALCQAAAAAGTAAPRPLLLDVREPWEVALAALHLDGLETLNLPMGQIPARIGELDAARPVVCLCHHGMRSRQVAAYLEHQGFAAAYNLAGGIDAWSAQMDPAVPRY